MAKKIIPIISVIVISALGVLFLFDSSSYEDKRLANTFEVDAIYFEDQGIVEISYNDKSLKTNSVVLEILGMESSFQKIFEENNFVERIEFASVPKHGWKIHPVTIVIDHQEFGKIGIKTEIHSEDEMPSRIIYSP